MKLKSYFNPTRDARLVQTVEVRLAADPAPDSPFVLLGDLIHEPVDDNLSGAQKHDVSHVIFQHVQEQVFLKHQIQDMQRIRITIGGAFKLLDRVFVDQGQNRLGVNEETTINVRLIPADATNDGVQFQVSNPDLVTITADTGDGTFKFRGNQKGEFFVRVRVNGFEQNIPYEVTEELPAVVLVDSITVPGAAITLTVAAPTFQLVPTVLPANATEKGVTYVSSTPANVTVSETGLVTRVANGTSTITIAAKDASGKSVTKLVTATA